MQLGAILCNLNKFKKIKRRVVSGCEKLFVCGVCMEGETGVHYRVTSCPRRVTFLS